MTQLRRIPPCPLAYYLLVARKGGKSSTRRQRRFKTHADVQRAKDRWAAEGFNTWWLFYCYARRDAQPVLLSHWTTTKGKQNEDTEDNN